MITVSMIVPMGNKMAPISVTRQVGTRNWSRVVERLWLRNRSGRMNNMTTNSTMAGMALWRLASVQPVLI